MDTVGLGLNDYFEIVKKPMDLGTVKKKLYNNVYSGPETFLADIELVFSNCRLYNLPGSAVIGLCDVVQSLYIEQLPLSGLDKYQR